jgi:hypothetical protein
MNWRTGLAGSMPSILRDQTFWIAGAATLVFLAAAFTLPTQPFFEAVRIIEGTTSTAALVAYSPAICFSITNRDPDRVDALSLTIGMMLLCFVSLGMWLTLFRLSATDGASMACDPTGRAAWMLDTYVFTFITGWLPSIASIMLLTIPGVLRRDEQVGVDPAPALLIGVGCVAGAGLLATMIVLATKPDTRWLVEALRPWVR